MKNFEAILGLIIVGIVILGILAFFLFVRQFTYCAKVRLDWKNKLAAGLGLSYVPRTLGFGDFLGSHFGRKVRLYTRQDGDRFFTCIEAELSNPTSGTMEVRFVGYGAYAYEYVLGEVKKFLGAQEIEVGDPDFDEAFRIKGMPENFVHGVLGSAHLRQRLLELDTEWPFMRVRDNELYFSVNGIEHSVDDLSPMLDLVCEFAESVERTGT